MTAGAGTGDDGGTPAAPVPLLRVQFCGEWSALDPDEPFTIGREATLVVDDNPYLHRQFLELRWQQQWWWLANIGAQLSATISDVDGGVHAWLAPGARLPVVFATTSVRFTAGPTSYELTLHLDDEAPMSVARADRRDDGTTTVGRVSLTPDQTLLVLALAEPSLASAEGSAAHLPSSADAARRLGWTMSRFNRKLDNVCQKLTRNGVRGLHGKPGQLASNRRARLVEYALAVRMVTAADLPLLDRAADGSDDEADDDPVSNEDD
jgi:hypothetical protein